MDTTTPRECDQIGPRTTTVLRALRRIKKRASYANVVSTIALFVALGGASYAAVALAPNSVGSRQVRAGAITPPKLAFPLGVSVSKPAGPQTLIAQYCNSALCPPPRAATLASLTLVLRRPASVLLVASGSFLWHSDGTSSAAAQVGIGVDEDGTSTVLPGSAAQVDAQHAVALTPVGVVAFSAGRHTFALSASAGAGGPGITVTAERAQLAAFVLPSLP